MTVLRTENLHCAFGSLVVTKDVNLTVEQGERHVIIGPNGAGKTSLINQIGGQLHAGAGRILLGDADITRWAPNRIAQAGVARTFQRNNLFPSLSVLENLRLAVAARRGWPWNFFAPADSVRPTVTHAEALLAQVHIAGDPRRLVRNLSYGEQRQLEIGVALAGDPVLLLLDEPTSGMSPAETQRMIALIAGLPRTLSILMIEHDMDVVFTLADRITVLYYGEILASGRPEENPRRSPRPRGLSGHAPLMLELDGVHTYYGDSHVLRGVSLTVDAGEVVCLLGRNGAGKTTTVLTAMGYLKPRHGRVRYRGRDLASLPPYEIARLGVGFVPQERGIFPSLTVRENLTVFARTGDGAWTLPRIHELFPVLESRGGNLGFQLSGGEQQMLSIARALMLNPNLLLLDEPSEGLAPMILEQIVAALKSLKNEGLGILLVEQNLRTALALGDRHHVLNKGEICYTGSSAELGGNEQVLRDYLSV